MRSDIMQQAQAIRASMDRAAGYLTDRQAASVPLQYLPHELVGHYFTEV